MTDTEDPRNITHVHFQFMKACPVYVENHLRVNKEYLDTDRDNDAQIHRAKLIGYQGLYNHVDNCETCTTIWVAARMEQA